MDVPQGGSVESERVAPAGEEVEPVESNIYLIRLMVKRKMKLSELKLQRSFLTRLLMCKTRVGIGRAWLIRL